MTFSLNPRIKQVWRNEKFDTTSLCFTMFAHFQQSNRFGNKMQVIPLCNSRTFFFHVLNFYLDYRHTTRHVSNRTSCRHKINMKCFLVVVTLSGKRGVVFTPEKNVNYSCNYFHE